MNHKEEKRSHGNVTITRKRKDHMAMEQSQGREKITWQWNNHKEEKRSHGNGTITRKRKDHVAILAQKSNLCITWTHLITVTVDLYRTTSEKEIICLN